MSKYTTGELAKLCGVTVRTVQYYDSRNILVPSALSEGGRRLYSQEDVHKLRIICFLRGLDLPISSIAALFAEKDPGEVITLLLEQQESVLRSELQQRQEKLLRLEELRRELKAMDCLSVESIGDIAYKMESRQKLRRTRGVLLAVGIPLDIAEVAAIAFAIARRVWWPVLLWLAADLLLGALLVRYYYRRVFYICPQCHRVFRPRFREFLWTKHTPSLRKLTCNQCGHKGYCIETCIKE